MAHRLHSESDQTLGTVTVLGGGLAGMTAAYRLASRGYDVTLIERRPYLGGRAYSFTDQDTGEQVDNGQHVFLGCCTAFTQLLQDIGTLSRTTRQRRLRIEVRSPSGKRGVLSGLPLPAPLHLAWSFLRYPHLDRTEKIAAAKALLRIKRERNRDRSELQSISFGEWLREHGQSERSIDHLWDLIVVPSLNDSSDNVSASVGFMVFQVALLNSNSGANVGFATEGLSDAIGTPMAQRLESLGAELLLARTVESVELGADGLVNSVTLAGGKAVRSDWYVSALPPDVMLDLLPEEQRSRPGFADARLHDWSPIVNLHVWYDRRVADFEFAAFVDSPVQWVFNRSRIAKRKERGQYLTVSLSAAWDYWPMSKDDLREAFIPELERVLPAAGKATIERFVIVKERRATFRSLPGGPSNRLPSATPIANLFLAGDWTDTGWPSTMESAVRSGNAAAEAVQRASLGDYA